MRFLSLFAGIGGFDLGLERAGWECVGQIEVDQFCRNVLQRHWPHVRRRGDIRLVDDELAREWWGGVDAIVGGFPCQDVSVAGKGAGVERGARSGLWREFHRLIVALRPRWVIVENVPALRTRGADRVLGDLEASDYSATACVVGADDVGAPHRRKRVWIVGRLADAEGERRTPEGNDCGRHAGESGARVADANGDALRDESGRLCGTDGASAPVARASGVADSNGAGRERERIGGLLEDTDPQRGNDVVRCHPWPARPGQPQHEWEPARTVEPSLRGRPDGVSRRLALKAYGNSVVPQIPELIGRAINALEAA